MGKIYLSNPTSADLSIVVLIDERGRTKTYRSATYLTDLRRFISITKGDIECLPRWNILSEMLHLET